MVPDFKVPRNHGACLRGRALAVFRLRKKSTLIPMPLWTLVLRFLV